MKKVVTILLVLLAFAVGGCSSKQEPPAASTQKPQQTQAVSQKSAVKRMTEDSFLATSEKSFDELVDFCIDNNEEAAFRMIKRGEVFFIKKGTRVIILENGGLTHYVEIDEGPMDGKRGYVATEFVE